MMQIVFQNVQKRMAAPTPAGGQIKVLWQTAGTKLVQDPDTGEIKGVVALQNQKGYGAPNGDTEITIKAKRAVVTVHRRVRVRRTEEEELPSRLPVVVLHQPEQQR